MAAKKKGVGEESRLTQRERREDGGTQRRGFWEEEGERDLDMKEGRGLGVCGLLFWRAGWIGWALRSSLLEPCTFERL